MKQNVQIAISVTIVGVLYLMYTKYTEFMERQLRLETNLRNVITAVNNHYISQMEDQEKSEQEPQQEEFSDLSDDSDSEFDTDEDEDEDVGELVTDRVYNETFGNIVPVSDSEDSGPIQITKNMHCPVTLTQGKNKGSLCGKKSVKQGYCKLHLKRIPVPNISETPPPPPTSVVSSPTHLP